MSSSKFDEKVFEKLAEILKTNDLTEIEYNEGETKIRIARQLSEKVSYIQQAPAVLQHSEPSTGNQDKCEQKTDYKSQPGAVVAKMVGTCYLAPEPGAKKFVELGNEVNEGDPLLIIEAMKVMNIIKAHVKGKIVHIAAKDGEPVEFGQLLMVIE